MRQGLSPDGGHSDGMRTSLLPSIPALPAQSWASLFTCPDGSRPAIPPGLRVRHPKVCWYVSAGHDFRPLVYFSKVYRSVRLPHLHLPGPRLFVYSCLGGGEDGLHELHTGQVLFHDGRSKLTLLSRQPLRLDRQQVDYRIDPRFVHFGEDPLLKHDHDAALLEVEVRSLTLGTCERMWVLYLAMENLNCFDALMSRGFFEVTSLCATREGVGFGGCGKSIIKHVFAEGRLLGANFPLRHVITWGDYTDELFRVSARPFFPGLRRAANYIGEGRGGTGHYLYQLHPDPVEPA